MTFKEGDHVTSKKYGLGVVTKIYLTGTFEEPVQVKFDNSNVYQTFTEKGHYHAGLCVSGSGRDYSSDLRNIKKVRNDI